MPLSRKRPLSLKMSDPSLSPSLADDLADDTDPPGREGTRHVPDPTGARLPGGEAGGALRPVHRHRAGYRWPERHHPGQPVHEAACDPERFRQGAGLVSRLQEAAPGDGAAALNAADRRDGGVSAAALNAADRRLTIPPGRSNGMQFRDKNIEGANFRNLPERNPTFGAHSREDGAGLRDLPHTGGMGLRRISGQRRRIPTLKAMDAPVSASGPVAWVGGWRWVTGATVRSRSGAGTGRSAVIVRCWRRSTTAIAVRSLASASVRTGRLHCRPSPRCRRWKSDLKRTDRSGDPRRRARGDDGGTPGTASWPALPAPVPDQDRLQPGPDAHARGSSSATARVATGSPLPGLAHPTVPTPPMTGTDSWTACGFRSWYSP